MAPGEGSKEGRVLCAELDWTDHIIYGLARLTEGNERRHFLLLFMVGEVNYYCG